MILKTIKEPQDIIIIGSYIKKGEQYWGDVLITDDYMSIDVMIGTQCWNMETDGFVNILTREEFDQNRHIFGEEMHESFLLLPGFSGEIGLTALIEKDEESNFEIITEFDLDEYIHDQCPIDWEDYMGINTRLHLPKGTVIIEVDGETEFDDQREMYVWDAIDNPKTSAGFGVAPIGVEAGVGMTPKQKIIKRLQSLVNDYQKESDKCYGNWENSSAECDNDSHMEAQAKSYALIEAIQIIEEEL